MTDENTHKPIVETLINTAAIAISAYGVTQITQGIQTGYFAVVFAMILEFGKYYGRKKQLW